MVDSADLIRKVRFPRQLVAFSVVATQAVTFAVMLAILIVLSLIFIPGARTTVWLVAAARAVLRRPRRRPRAHRRVVERRAPRRRAHPHGGAPAVVLPHADPLELRDARREPGLAPQADGAPALGQPRRAADRRAPRCALERPRPRPPATRSTSSPPPSSRSSSARSSSTGSTTGSRSSSRRVDVLVLGAGLMGAQIGCEYVARRPPRHLRRPRPGRRRPPRGGRPSASRPGSVSRRAAATRSRRHRGPSRSSSSSRCPRTWRSRPSCSRPTPARRSSRPTPPRSPSPSSASGSAPRSGRSGRTTSTRRC